MVFAFAGDSTITSDLPLALAEEVDAVFLPVVLAIDITILINLFYKLYLLCIRYKQHIYY